MEGASFYTQLAALEVAAILETLPNNCEDLISSKVRANCRELSSLLLGLCDKDVGKEATVLAVKVAMKTCEGLVASYSISSFAKLLRNVVVSLAIPGCRTKPSKLSKTLWIYTGN